MTRRTPLYAAALLTALAAVGCTSASAGTTGTGTAAAPKPAATFSDGGVTVALSLGNWDGNKGTASITFTPEKAGYHIYSMDLPPDGIDGLGRPTVIKLTGSLTMSGAPSTTSAIRQITDAGTSTEVPVYPDGPVTFTVPLAKSGTGEATTLISYAACSEDGCLAPVDDHPVALTVGDQGIAVRH
ncbi:protein-disulfide reductase DsbD family protein [Kitasatospora sp. NPDC048540]|uniref:protein-disulfide reductase DsbD family protein n=1 Tax=unclassified Kitasatospora TaxID=2633591 RepID=UPI000A6E0D07|nr:protein-disulfide reductase DsbD family protein [Kitasatospora sp. MBT63]